MNDFQYKKKTCTEIFLFKISIETKLNCLWKIMKYLLLGGHIIKKYLLHRVVVEKHPKPSEKIKKI